MIEPGDAPGIDPTLTRLTLAALDQIMLTRIAGATSMPEVCGAVREWATLAERELIGVGLLAATELRASYRELIRALERVLAACEVAP